MLAFIAPRMWQTICAMNEIASRIRPIGMPMTVMMQIQPTIDMIHMPTLKLKAPAALSRTKALLSL